VSSPINVSLVGIVKHGHLDNTHLEAEQGAAIHTLGFRLVINSLRMYYLNSFLHLLETVLKCHHHHLKRRSSNRHRSQQEVFAFDKEGIEG